MRVAKWRLSHALGTQRGISEMIISQCIKSGPTAFASFASLCKLAMWKHSSHGDRSSSNPWPLQASRCSKAFPHADNYPFEFLRHESIEHKPLANVIKHKLRPMVSTLLKDGDLLRIRMMTIEVQRSRLGQYTRGAIEGGTGGVTIGGAIGAAAGACTAGIAAVPLDFAVSGGVGAVCVSFAAVGGVLGSAVVGGVGGALGAMTGAAKVAVEPPQFRETQVFVEDYRDSLQLLLEVLWNVERSTVKMKSDSDLEKEIFRRSTQPQELSKLRDQIRTGSLRERVPERYKGLRDARFIDKTLLQIVDRAALIYDICRADEILHHACKVILVVGEENVGKSSLLKCILSKCGEDKLAETIEVGEITHTRNLKVYRGNLKLSGGGSGDLLLVDAPGTSTPENRNEDTLAWQCMERVPDMCFAMIEFKGDVQRGSADLMTDIHERKVCLRQNQVLLVNRMDSRLHGTKKAQVWKDLNREKLEEMRSQFARNSGIRKENVLMTVLDEDSVYPEQISLMRERGVLVQKEATEKILSILQGLFTN